MTLKPFCSTSVFQSTRPARGATCSHLPHRGTMSISIHAPREGRDVKPKKRRGVIDDFNPRAPRGARHQCQQFQCHSSPISIHAPREGRDGCRGKCGRRDHISIHAPREGCDVLVFITTVTWIKFQSTRPARGATCWLFVYIDNYCKFQSTRPARGATFTLTATLSLCLVFQSTRPARGATSVVRSDQESSGISIHAPREGRDTIRIKIYLHQINFNPRAPRGARLYRYGTSPRGRANFNPRAPRGARPQHSRDPNTQ